MNNNHSGLTSAFVTENAEEDNSSIFSLLNDKTESDQFTIMDSEEFTEKVEGSVKEISMDLTFNKVPAIKKEVKVENIQLKFDNLDTKINVNDDKLELNNLREVDLNIESFSGEIDFDNSGVSIDGVAKRLRVNDIALSSPGEIEISFSDLDYKFLDIDSFQLKEVDFSVGDGNLEVVERLNYNLRNERVNIYYFTGQLTIDKEFKTETSLVGKMRGVAVDGDTLTFMLN